MVGFLLCVSASEPLHDFCDTKQANTSNIFDELRTRFQGHLVSSSPEEFIAYEVELIDKDKRPDFFTSIKDADQ